MKRDARNWVSLFLCPTRCPTERRGRPSSRVSSGIRFWAMRRFLVGQGVRSRDMNRCPSDRYSSGIPYSGAKHSWLVHPCHKKSGVPKGLPRFEASKLFQASSCISLRTISSNISLARTFVLKMMSSISLALEGTRETLFPFSSAKLGYSVSESIRKSPSVQRLIFSYRYEKRAKASARLWKPFQPCSWLYLSVRTMCHLEVDFTGVLLVFTAQSV